MEKLDLAWQLYDEGNYAESEKLYEDCLRESGTEPPVSILMGLIYVKCSLRKFDEARVHGHALLRIAEKADALDLHIALHQNGMIERMAENYDQALQLFIEEEQIIHRDFPGDSMRIAVNLYEQAYVLHKQGCNAEALALMDRSLQQAIRSADPMTIACSHRGMGEIEKALGHAETAVCHFQQSIASFRQADDALGVAEVETLLADLQ